MYTRAIKLIKRYCDILDIRTNIIRQVEDETGTEVEPTAIRYYEETETFLVGYAHADLREEVEGGVLVISKTGLLQERIALPFVPTFFIRP